MPWLVRAVLAAALAVSVIAVPPPRPSQAAGPDPCREPNDEFQQACPLADGSQAVGYLFHANDLDAYRIEALDFNVKVRLELVEMPAPYQFILADWNGQRLAASAPDAGREVIDTTLGPPGVYYAFVGTQFGGFSDEAPYRLTAQLTYPSGSAPRVLYSREFREGTIFTGRVGRTDYVEEGGKYIIAQEASGTREQPWTSTQVFGPLLSDFTLVFDASIVGGSSAGYHMRFRRRDNDNFYYLTVDPGRQLLSLARRVGGQVTNPQGWQRTDAINETGNNRTIIRATGASVRVNLNGRDVAEFVDDSLRAGSFEIGALTWADPARVQFDNVLVTARPVVTTPGTVLLADNFDSFASGVLGMGQSQAPHYAWAYRDGDYVVERLEAASTLQSTIRLPIITTDSSLAVDARLVGETANRIVALSCRRDLPNPATSEYRFTVRPDLGRFRLERWDNGTEVALAGPQDSAAIKRGNEQNRLELKCVGPTITARVNGVEVATVQDKRYTEGVMGFTVFTIVPPGGNAEAHFDNLLVTQE